MKIEVRKYKRLASLCDETDCFSAEIVVDGVALAGVENRGNGGANMYYRKPDTDGRRAERQAAFDAAAAAYGKANGFEVEMDDAFVESLICDLEEARERERMKRKNAKKGFPVTLRLTGSGKAWYVGLKEVPEAGNVRLAATMTRVGATAYEVA